MLQKLNERIQGFAAWLFVILIALAFTLFGVDYFFQSHQNSSAKVVVNDQPISHQIFESNYRRARSQQDSEALSAESEKQLQKTVLDEMLVNLVTAQAAHKTGFSVNPAQAIATITHVPQFQEEGRFSLERYQQALSSALLTAESFQNEVQEGMLLNQQRFAFMGSAFVLPEEVERFVRLFMQTRDYKYLLIPYAAFEPKVVVSDEAIKQYYDTHPDEFKIAERVSLDYVKLSMRELRASLQITEDEIKRYYDENHNQYLNPAQWQVAHILFAVPTTADETEIEAIKEKADGAYQQAQKNPEQFSQLVRQWSDDKLSAMKDGELPWVVAGHSDYDKLLLDLTQPGQISAPVRTKHGFEIFKLMAYKPASIKPFAEVKKLIREQLTAEMVQAKYAQAMETLSDLSYQMPDSLNAVSEALKLPVLSTEAFDQKGGKAALTQNKRIINAAFSHDVLFLKNNSEPLQLDEDVVIVLRIKQHFPETEKSFASVKADIKAQLVKQAAIAKAKALGERLLVANEQQEQALRKEYQLNWHEISNAARETDQANTAINELAFASPRPGHREGLLLEEGQYALVQLKAIRNGQMASLDKEQQKSIVQQIEANYGMIDYELYVNNLMSQAKIEYPKTVSP